MSSTFYFQTIFDYWLLILNFLKIIFLKYFLIERDYKILKAYSYALHMTGICSSRPWLNWQTLPGISWVQNKSWMLDQAAKSTSRPRNYIWTKLTHNYLFNLALKASFFCSIFLPNKCREIFGGIRQNFCQESCLLVSRRSWCIKK